MNPHKLHLKLNPQRTTSNIFETMNSIKLSSQVVNHTPTSPASAATVAAIANHLTNNNITIATTNIAMNNSKKVKKVKKSVRFSELCKVILIPMRHEYSAAGIYLWWTKQDFMAFRKGYITEKRNEKAAEAALTSSTLANPSESLPSPSPSVPNSVPNSVLMITNQTNSEQLISQISGVMTSQPTFTILTHEEVAEISSSATPPPKYDNVIIDGTDDCDCYELNPHCSIHSINRLSTINTIRSLSISSNITLFVDNSTINKESIQQLCSLGDILPSDLMILTPDSWTGFQQLIQSVQSSINSEKRTHALHSVP